MNPFVEGKPTEVHVLPFRVMYSLSPPASSVLPSGVVMTWLIGVPLRPACDQVVPPMTLGSWLTPRGCMLTTSAGAMARANPAQNRRPRARRRKRAR